MLVHPKGKVVKRHRHKLVKREIFRTQEVLLLLEGKVRVEICTDEGEKIKSFLLRPGDAVLLARGGHSVKVLEACQDDRGQAGPLRRVRRQRVLLMIPVNEPLLARNTLRYVSDCVRTGWISSAGAYIGKFEAAFADYLGVEHAVTTTSGTTALHLALAALNIGPGDEVVIPSQTMIAVPYAVLYTGAKPVILDVDRETFNLDPDRLESS